MKPAEATLPSSPLPLTIVACRPPFLHDKKLQYIAKDVKEPLCWWRGGCARKACGSIKMCTLLRCLKHAKGHFISLSQVHFTSLSQAATRLTCRCIFSPSPGAYHSEGVAEQVEGVNNGMYIAKCAKVIAHVVSGNVRKLSLTWSAGKNIPAYSCVGGCFKKLMYYWSCDWPKKVVFKTFLEEIDVIDWSCYWWLR